jgi:hypothetical protein
MGIFDQKSTTNNETNPIISALTSALEIVAGKI